MNFGWSCMEIQKMWRLFATPLQRQQCATFANVSLEIESASINKWPAVTTAQSSTQNPYKNYIFAIRHLKKEIS